MKIEVIRCRVNVFHRRIEHSQQIVQVSFTNLRKAGGFIKQKMANSTYINATVDIQPEIIPIKLP
jgi:hypothetical protein